MTRGALAERMRLAAFVAGQGWRLLLAHLPGLPLSLGRVSIPVPERLLIAPQDLRTGDATRASEIYAGRFAFAGKIALL
ncbi:MAG: hypothetical protein B7Z45_01680, partial [Azorhizobium sp. 12-66-6]